MKKLIQNLLLVACLLLTVSAFAQKPLRYNLENGKVYGLKQMAVQNIEQSVMGMSQDIKSTIGGDITVTIKGKNGDVYDAEVVFKTMVFKLEAMTMTMAYDSENPEADSSNPLNKAFDLMVGHVFDVKFDDRGVVKDVKGFETISQKITQTFSDNPQQAEQMKQTLSGQFSDEKMKYAIGSLFIIYPEEKVRVGSKWSSDSKLAQPVVINNKFDYTIQNLGSDVVKLTGVGTMKTAEGQSIKQGGMVQHFDLNGNVEVIAAVDAKTGWPTEVKMTQKLDGNVAIEMPQSAAPVEMPMKINSEITYSSF